MDTIFANATPIAKSGVCVVRISGSKAQEVLKRLIKSELPEPRVFKFSSIYNIEKDSLLDKALVCWFAGPASFTGEDVVEIHLHGSIAVVSALFAALSKIDGVRMAEPGEFSRRAFENGKMNLTEAEGLSDLIAAETGLQASQALRQMQGALHDLYNDWRKKLIKAMSYLEAFIDFPDEEIPEEIAKDISGQVEKLRSEISGHLDDGRCGERLREGLCVAIIGAPNVGKSSLLNHLAKKDLAIVSDIAGTTRDVVELHVDLGGFPVVFADTAGLREKADEIEEEGIRRAVERSKDADFVIAMFDAEELDSPDAKTLEVMSGHELVVINKSDKKAVSSGFEIRGVKPIVISLKEGAGLDELLNKIENKAKSLINVSSSPVITRARHRELLIKALYHLDQFSLGDEVEIAAENLRMAARYLGKIIGVIDVEDILDSLFKDFCIGK